MNPFTNGIWLLNFHLSSETYLEEGSGERCTLKETKVNFDLIDYGRTKNQTKELAIFLFTVGEIDTSNWNYQGFPPT
jgi:hypothetical protein